MSVRGDVDAGTARRQHRTVARRGAVALVLSLVVNAAVSTAARAADVGVGLDAMTYSSVLSLTTVGVVAAAAVYLLLDRVTARTDRYFLIVAALALVLSVVPDFTIIPVEPGGSVTAGVVLASMHATTALITVGLLVDWRRIRRSESG